MYSTCDSLSAGRNPGKYPKMECFAARGCASFPVAACGPRPPRPQCRVKVTYALSTGPSSSHRLAFHGTPKIFCLGRIRWLFFLVAGAVPGGDSGLDQRHGRIAASNPACDWNGSCWRPWSHFTALRRPWYRSSPEQAVSVTARAGRPCTGRSA